MRLLWFTRAEAICATRGEYDFTIFKMPAWIYKGSWRAVITNGTVTCRRHFGSAEDAKNWCDSKAERINEGE